MAGGTSIEYCEIDDVDDTSCDNSSDGPNVTRTAVDSDGRFLYVLETTGDALETWALDTPHQSPSFIRSFAISGASAVLDIQVQNSIAYITDSGNSNLYIVNVSDLDAPVLIKTLAMDESATSTPHGLVIAGRYAYVAMADQAVHVIDVLDPNNPLIVQQINVGAHIRGIDVDGRYLIALAQPGGQFLIYDLGGLDVFALSAGSLEAGELSVRQNLEVAQDILARGNLFVNDYGYFSGPVTIAPTSGTTTREALEVVSRESNGLKLNAESNTAQPVYALSIGRGTAGNETSSSSSNPIAWIENGANVALGDSWGLYVDKLLVGSDGTATGTANYGMKITYAGGAAQGGLCIDDSVTGQTCPTSISSASILADNAITASAFDIAEIYSFSGSYTDGDVLSLDTGVSTTVKQSAGIPYDPTVIGIASTDPGLSSVGPVVPRWR